MHETTRLIAFYLPQFHPIPQNDAWWGKGFTEWRNVARATPLFAGHYQPHIPADLGFYDLRLPQTRMAQAELAKAFGIHGFCYWHYWFNGQRLLELPFQEVLESKEPDFPFCLAWANENWTRRWDGEDQQVLMRQEYSHDDDVAHVRWMIDAFRDPRYIKIDGKPLVLIYRVTSLPDPAATAQTWREEARKAGLPGIYLCTIVSLPAIDFDPKKIGFDAAVEFQPNWSRLPERVEAGGGNMLQKLVKWGARDGGDVYQQHFVRSYRKLADLTIGLEEVAYKRFPCVTPGWDNSPRRKAGANVFVDSDPETYGRWLRHAIQRSKQRFNGEERLVFINAWNEWAEGNHLEPDLKWGLRYLEETAGAAEDARTVTSIPGAFAYGT